MPNSLQAYIPQVITFLSDTVIPFILAIGFLFVVVNIVRYYIISINGAGDKKQGIASGKERAKAYLVYSIFAFVIIIIFSGLVNLLAKATELDTTKVTTPSSDYIKKFK